MMVVPVDPHVGEAEHVDEELGHLLTERGKIGAKRCLELESHDRDDHGHDAVAEGLEAMSPKRAC